MNKTGIEPVQFRVLISVDEVGEQTKGGIWLAETTLEREQMGHDRGTLIAKSDMAFSDWNGTKPQVGDKIIFKKFAGTIIKYRDEKKVIGEYRLCNDKEILAIIKE